MVLYYAPQGAGGNNAPNCLRHERTRPHSASEAHCQGRMPHTLCQAITGSSDTIGAVGCLSVADGSVKVLDHRSAQTLSGGHGGTAPAADADALPLQVGVGGADGADCLCHDVGGVVN